MIAEMTVADIMNRQPPVATPDMSLTEVIDLFAKRHTSGVPVVDENRQVIGFVSEQDCLKKMLESSYYCETPAKVSEVMREDVLSVPSSMAIVDLASSMNPQKPRLYPVIDQGKLVGLVNRLQILEALRDNQNACAVKPTA